MSRAPRANRAPRAAVAVTAAVLVVAGLSACSGSSATGASSDAQTFNPMADHLAGDPLTAVRAAADITGHNGFLKDTTTLHTASVTKQMTLHGTGAYDYADHLGKLSVDVPPGAGTSATGQLNEVTSPGIVYMQNSGAKVPKGKWIKLGVQQLGDGNLVSSGATDPASASDALRGAQTAKLVGTSTVDGVVLTHYKGTLDLSEAAKATGGPGGTGLDVAAHTFTVKNVPYDVWLDSHGRIAKVVEVFTFSQVPGSTVAKDQVVVTSTSAFSDFGTPVAITVPADQDIVSPSAAPSGK